MLYFQRWKITLILLTILAGFVVLVPSFLAPSTVQSWPDWMPKRQLVLGLDLQGGSHLLLEVERSGLIEDRLRTLTNDVRRILREARIEYTGIGSQGASVQVRISDLAQLPTAQAALAELVQPGGVTVFGTTSPPEVEITADPDGLVHLTLTPVGIEQRVRSAVSQSIEVVRRRIDELGTTEPNIQGQGADRIIVQVPGLDDPERLKELLQQTAQLTFRMVDVSMTAQQALATRPPADSEILYDAENPTIPYLVERDVLVSGEDLVDAQASFDQTTNQPVVNFRFNTTGARRFAEATQQNVGRPFAIVLDDKVISAPNIREPIIGGTGQIEGGFTVETANDLAILLRAGALPADLTIVEERTVGPSLGQDSINAGMTAGLLAAAAVAVFMLAIYGLFGFFALIALTVNIILMFAVQIMIGATLTLPGIAGVILTIGMAVDSNVVIFERIRDEAREGRSPLMAIDKGFGFALGTIMDANVTAFLTALILFLFGGSGPVRGFAITFMIGIITTVFTAYTLTRLMLSWWVRNRRPAELPI